MKTYRIFLHSILVVAVMTGGCFRKDKELRLAKTQESINKQVLLAKEYLSNGNKSQAISLLEDLEKKHPHETKVIEALGFAYSDGGDSKSAAFYFEKLLNESPLSHEFRIFTAQAYIENKAYEEASRHYRSYLEAFPNDRSTWKLLSKAYELNNDDVAALEAYLKAEELTISQPKEKDLLKLAQLYQKLNKFEDAKARCCTVLKHNPKSIEAHVRLLKIETQLENWNEAQKYLAKLESMPSNKVDPTFITSVKKVLAKKQKLGCNHEGVAITAKVNSSKVKSAKDWHELFVQSMKKKDLIQAELAAQEAIKIEPDNISYTFDYLKAIKAKGSDQDLLIELKKAKVRFANNADITLALAQTQHKVDGNLQNAKSSYEEFLKQAPSHTKSEQVKKLLATL